MNITEISPVKMGDLSGLKTLSNAINIIIWIVVVVVVIIGIKQISGDLRRSPPKGIAIAVILLIIVQWAVVPYVFQVILDHAASTQKDEEPPVKESPSFIGSIDSDSDTEEGSKDPIVHSYDPIDISKDLSAQLLEAAACGDRERIRTLFAKTARECEGFEEETDHLVKNCPKGDAAFLDSVLKYGFKPIKYDVYKYLSNDGNYYTQKMTAQIDGKNYYIYADVCYRHSDPDEEGLLFFCIQDEKSNAKSYKEKTDYSSQTIVCEINK